MNDAAPRKIIFRGRGRHVDYKITKKNKERGRERKIFVEHHFYMNLNQVYDVPCCVLRQTMRHAQCTQGEAYERFDTLYLRIIMTLISILAYCPTQPCYE